MTKDADTARAKIPDNVEAAVLLKSARRCPLCYHLNGDLDEKLGQIAHLDQSRSNPSEDNLAFMCMPHHSVYDSTTRQHKNYTLAETKTMRDALYLAIKDEKHHKSKASQPQPAINVTSNHQAGGLTAGIVNMAPQPRLLDASLKQQLLGLIPDNHMADVVTVMGDPEAYSFAAQIKEFLLQNGRKITEGSISQAIFMPPPTGQSCVKEEDIYKIVIGHKS